MAKPIHKEPEGSITRFVKRRFGTWLVHWHKEIEIVQVLEGPAPFTVGENSYLAHEGDFFITRGCEPHQFLFDRQNKKLVQICKFNIGLMYGLSKHLHYPKAHITKEEIDAIPGLYQKLCEAFEEIEKNADGKGNDILADCYTVLLYSLLSESFTADDDISDCSLEETVNFERLIDYIDHNYKKSISLQILADEINYSVNYVSNLFKKHGIMTYKKYLDNVRISHAAEFLRQKDAPKGFSEISSLCGFDNIRTFNNTFKRIMGCTPSEYKNRQ